MAQTGVTVDASAFVAGFDSHMKHIEAQTKAAARRFAASAASRMIGHIHSESGELAGHVRVDDNLNEMPSFIEVGVMDETEHPHAAEVEFGTSRMQARPFARPGIAEAVADFVVEA